MSEKVVYLGDGVYALFDGYQIELRVNDSQHPTDIIYIDRDVWEALILFGKRMGFPILFGGEQP